MSNSLNSIHKEKKREDKYFFFKHVIGLTPKNVLLVSEPTRVTVLRKSSGAAMNVGTFVKASSLK